ncbi:FYVE/PHD zinc finger [Phytophthora palmivora]|uniref:FYVE/PHD zinc finger n=1 Tax=Phytophthora palmivora TaxID=4796 RepID=A0A2P4YQN9_9STRA|nr:FYVE/PHD zinc finger [Phytophthora palmivora]
MSKESESTDATSAAPADSAAPIDTETDDLIVGTPETAADLVLEQVHDAAVGTQDSTLNNALDASEGIKSEGKESVDQVLKCSECERVESANRGDQLRVCVGCKVAVHTKCYVNVLPLTDEMENIVAEKKDKEMETSEWKFRSSVVKFISIPAAVRRVRFVRELRLR